MNEKLKKFKEKIAPFFKNVTIYGIILCSIVASFFIGVFYNEITNKNKSSKVQVKTIVKSEVNLAIDENNHLIVIEKKQVIIVYTKIRLVKLFLNYTPKTYGVKTILFRHQL